MTYPHVYQTRAGDAACRFCRCGRIAWTDLGSGDNCPAAMSDRIASLEREIAGLHGQAIRAMADEREAVVAYLRRVAEEVADPHLHALADAVERGDHREAP